MISISNASANVLLAVLDSCSQIEATDLKTANNKRQAKKMIRYLTQKLNEDDHNSRKQRSEKTCAKDSCKDKGSLQKTLSGQDQEVNSNR